MLAPSVAKCLKHFKVFFVTPTNISKVFVLSSSQKHCAHTRCVYQWTVALEDGEESGEDMPDTPACNAPQPKPAAEGEGDGEGEDEPDDDEEENVEVSISTHGTWHVYGVGYFTYISSPHR